MRPDFLPVPELGWGQGLHFAGAKACTLQAAITTETEEQEAGARLLPEGRQEGVRQRARVRRPPAASLRKPARLCPCCRAIGPAASRAPPPQQARRPPLSALTLGYG